MYEIMGGLEKETGGGSKTPIPSPPLFARSPPTDRRTPLGLGGGLRCSGERKGASWAWRGCNVAARPTPPPRPRLHEPRRRSRGEGGGRGRRRAAVSLPLARYISLLRRRRFSGCPTESPPPPSIFRLVFRPFAEKGRGTSLVEKGGSKN